MDPVRRGVRPRPEDDPELSALPPAVLLRPDGGPPRGDPGEATPDHVSDFLADHGDHGPARGQARRALRHFYRFARVTKRRGDDPTDLLPSPRRAYRPAPDWLTDEELCQLVYTATMYRAEWAWSLIWVFATGGRIDEACSAGPNDLNLAAMTVTFRHTKNGRDRVVHLGPTAYTAAQYLLRRNGTHTLLGVSPGAMRLRMKVLARLADLPEKKIHPHALRHTAGTLLSERGASQVEIMDFLGHVDPRMAAWYVHLTSARAKRTARLL